MPIQKFQQNQLVTTMKRGRRSFDAQFLARANDVFDVALERVRTFGWGEGQPSPWEIRRQPPGVSLIVPAA